MKNKGEEKNIKKLIDYASNKGVPVLKHSDGNIYPILEDMVESGIRGIHPIEPGAMNLEQVKKEYGRKISRKIINHDYRGGH